MYGADFTPRAAAAASSESIDTPSHFVSSLDHFVTQWMSVVTDSCGSASNSSHVQRATGPSIPRSTKSQVTSAVRGVGPAESTGKSRVSYWPGGSRAAVAPGCRRPRNPREMNGSVMMVQYPLAPRGYVIAAPARCKRPRFIAEYPNTYVR